MEQLIELAQEQANIILKCFGMLASRNAARELRAACRSGEKARVLKLLKQGVDPNSAEARYLKGKNPLYYACQHGWLDVVERLVEEYKCDPINVSANSWRNTRVGLRYPEITPLHIACEYGQMEVAKLLIEKYKCNPNIEDSLTQTPLHYACEHGKAKVAKLLIEQYRCNPNIQDASKRTPLHHACQNGHSEVVQLLVNMTECKVNILDIYGMTPLHYACDCKYIDIIKNLIVHGADPNVADSCGNTPLHNACSTGQLDIIKCLFAVTKCNPIDNNDGIIRTPLLSVVECDPNAKNKAGLTPLELTSPEHSHIIKELIAHGANPNVADRDGDTPLHIACQTGRLDLVYCLLTAEECDPNAKNKAGLTPLELTSPEHSHIVNKLIAHGANPNVADRVGNTPLHIACQTGRLDLVQSLLTVIKCNPDAKNKAGLTPLQVTSPWHSHIVKELVTHGASPSVANSDGNTPLHIACERHYFDTVKHLLTSADCDPNAKNKAGLTPLLVTSIRDTIIIRELIRHGANADDLYKDHGRSFKQPLQPPVKVFVVGDPSAGKSTLTAALQKESSFFGRRFKANQKVTGVDTKTAGVVPHDFESKEYGYATFYDFAGQREFYGSHAAVLQNTIQSSPPIFLIVADLCKSENEIKRTVLYWLTFLENQCASVSSKPHVIIVGSHADVLKVRGENPVSKINSLKPDTVILFSKFVFAGFIAMDCQYPESHGMSELRHCLKGSCNALRTKEIITFSAHCFYVYLVDKFKDSIAVSVEQIQAEIKAEDTTSKHHVTNFIPDSLHLLCKICDELNDRGHIFFLKDSQDIEQSWVVIDKKCLLAQVSGSIFAPEGFKQRTMITQGTCSTGVVPMSSIANSFPEHNPELLTKFLSCLEFCHEISDPEILHRITTEYVVNQSACRERYFLFPALVSLNVPKNVWDDKPEFECHFGWLLCTCTNARIEQFFTSRFLQVLLLRMGFSFPLSEGHTHHSNPAIQRNCSIWTNGIFWGNDRGVETLVEVDTDNKAVIVLMRCSKTIIVDLAELRSQVILQVLKAAEEFCSSITMVESFIDPYECKQYPLKPPSQLKLFSALNTSRAILDARPSTTVVSPTGTILLENLIQCEPYAGLGKVILREIFENQDQDTEVIPDAFLTQFSEAKIDHELFIKMFDPEHEVQNAATAQDSLSILNTWRTECTGTYKSLREKLDKFSIYAGRNPLV